jgi:serine/threonine protein kinase/WD40 repeat protein
MPLTRKCATCGATLAEGATGGHCPACLFQLGLTEVSAEFAATAPVPGPRVGAGPGSFDDYELLEPLGQGGMGVVYRARQKSLGRLVALKMVRGFETASPRLLARFHLEAQAAARLDHPNIVPIYETGEHDGQPWFSMKLIEGGSLARSICDLPLAYDEPIQGGHPLARSRLVSRMSQIASLLARVARAVHYAHQHGVLHRDLKSANILLDRDVTPYLTDFGIAKLLHEEVDLTRTIELLGTPSYMPPEIASGRAASVASDVYGLGAILYELLTGQPPFVGDTPMATIKKVVEEEPVPPSRLTVDDVRLKTGQADGHGNRTSHSTRRIPADLETICLKCLEKDPARRYPSALALAEDLERFFRNEPITARRASRRERVGRWCRRNPRLAGTLAGLLVVFAAGLGGVLWQWTRAKQHARSARAALARSQEALWQAEFERAHAWRVSGQMGQRVQALAAVSNAAAIRPAPELRAEAIAAMALTDLEDSGKWHPLPPDFFHLEVDGACERFAVRFTDGRIEVRQFSDGSLVAATTNRVKPWDIRLDPRGTKVGAFGPEGGFVWDLASQRFLHETQEPCSIAFSADGRQMLLGSRRRATVVLDSATQQEIAQLPLPFTPNPAYAPNHAAFAPRGDRIAFWHRPANRALVEIWNLNTRRKEAEWTASSDVINFAWNPDGTILAFGTHQRRIYLWAWAEGALLEFPAHSGGSLMVYMHPDGDLLASTSWDEILRLWDPHTGASLMTMFPLRPKGFSADGQWLAVLGPKGLGRLRVHRPAECRTLHHGVAEYQGANRLEFDPSSRWLASGNYEGSRVCDIAQGTIVWWHTLPTLAWGADQVFFLDPQSLLIVRGKEVHLWTNAGPAETWQPVLASTVLRFDFAPSYGALSPDGRQMVFEMNGLGAVYDLPAERKSSAGGTSSTSPTLPDESSESATRGIRPSAAFATNAAASNWFAFNVTEMPLTRPAGTLSPSDPERDGVRGGSSQTERTSVSPSVSISQPRARLIGQPLIAACAFSPDGQWIASGFRWKGEDIRSTVCLWSARDGRLERQIPSTSAHPYFSPDGRWLLVADAKDYRFFRVAGPPEDWPEDWVEPQGIQPSVCGAAVFARHRPWVALLDRMQIIRLMDLSSRRELARLIAPALRVEAMAWSADGRWLAAATQRNVHLWDLHRIRARLRTMNLDWDTDEPLRWSGAR